MDLLHRIWESDAFLALVISGISASFAAVFGAATVVVRRYFLRRLSAAELQLIREVAQTSVAAAEQMWKKENGEKKLSAAIDLAEAQLAAYGIKVQPGQLRAAIEASVLLYKAKLRLPEVPEEMASESISPGG